jgi:hypothetical protein
MSSRLTLPFETHKEVTKAMEVVAALQLENAPFDATTMDNFLIIVLK